jgi:hypothetical protein
MCEKSEQICEGQGPDFWAVHAVTGVHIGLWPNKADAEGALSEFQDGKLTPLWANPGTRDMCGFGVGGVTVYGTRDSIKAAMEWEHSHSTIDSIRTNLRHWRDECGKMHSRVEAATDHALILWAMCVGAGRWEPLGDLTGEFCMNGIRHFTVLDNSGCPSMTPGMREAIRQAGAPA